MKIAWKNQSRLLVLLSAIVIVSHFVLAADVLLERISILQSPLEEEYVISSTDNAAMGSEECTSDSDCTSCTQNCIRGSCLSTGLSICPAGTAGEGNCVYNNGDCGCAQACDPCEEFCFSDGTCRSSGSTSCADGSCVGNPDLCQSPTHTNCIPACGDCESCRPVGPGSTYVCVADYRGVKVCESGLCVPVGESCVEECSPACDPCERCVVDPDGSNHCADVGEKLCDGSCVSRLTDCTISQLFEEPVYENDPIISLYEFFIDYFSGE